MSSSRTVRDLKALSQATTRDAAIIKAELASKLTVNPEMLLTMHVAIGMDKRIPSLRAAGLNSTYISAFTHGNAAASVDLVGRIHNQVQMKAVEDAYSWSLRNMWIMFTCLASLGFVASAFIKHQDLSKEHTETRTGIDEMTKREGR